MTPNNHKNNQTRRRDLIDRKIIYELDLDARIPITQLAKKLRQPRETINYRIARLVQDGIIRKFVTMIDTAKLGYSVYKMYFKFQNIDKKTEEEAIAWLTQNKYIYWVATAKGKWDLNITIFANNINHFDEIMSGFITRYGQYIQEQEFNTTLSVGIMSKDWILPEQKKYSKIVTFGSKVIDTKIDHTDVEILRILANNARMPAMAIARKIKSTQKIVIYRMKQLEEKGIILGYTTSLDLEKLDMQFFKATIALNTLQPRIRTKIIEYCRNNPHIGFLIFCVGTWPLELELIVKNNTQFYAVMDELRQSIPEIRGYDTMIFPKEYKFDWMPLCYEAER